MSSEAEADELRRELARAKEETVRLHAELIGQKATITAYEKRLLELQAESATFGARLGRLVTRYRKRLAPNGSQRAVLLGKGLRAAERIYRYGYRDTIRIALAPKAESVPSRGPHFAPQRKKATSAEYSKWISAFEPTDDDLQAQREDARVQGTGPLISVLMPVYKISSMILEAAVNSIVAQTYGNWELCVSFADVGNEDNWALLERFSNADARVRVRRLDQNLGISGNTNAALEMAAGEYVALIDHDDELTPWALFDMAREIVEEPDVDFLYSDKDCIDETGTYRLDPLFKPDWSPEMLYSVNYLTHFNVMRSRLVRAVGAWRPETDGAQDWDIFYRVTERASKIRRVLGVHYHWRLLPSSTSTGLAAKPYALDAQLRTQQDRVRRCGLQAVVVANRESGFRLHWSQPNQPCVALVIVGTPQPTVTAFLNSSLETLKPWLASISVVCPEDEESVADLGEVARAFDIEYFGYADEADKVVSLNAAMGASTSKAFILLDGTLFHYSDDLIPELAGWVLGHPDIGFAGSILLQPGDVVLEAGRVVGKEGRTSAMFRNAPLYSWGIFGGPLWFRNVSAVGAHAVAFRRLTPQESQPDMQDDCLGYIIELCRRVRQAGLRGLVTPHARVTSVSAPAEQEPSWDESYTNDPYFHPGFRGVSPFLLREHKS